jgi:hypothetical protein
MPVNNFNNAPIDNVFFLPILSAEVVRYIVIIRSPANIKKSKVPMFCYESPIYERYESKATARDP